MIKLHFEDYNEYSDTMYLSGFDEEETVNVDLSIYLGDAFQSDEQRQKENIDRYIEMRVKDVFGDKAVIESLTNPYTEE